MHYGHCRLLLHFFVVFLLFPFTREEDRHDVCISEGNDVAHDVVGEKSQVRVRHDHICADGREGDGQSVERDVPTELQPSRTQQGVCGRDLLMNSESSEIDR